MKIKLIANFSKGQLSSSLASRKFSCKWDTESLSESPFYMKEGEFKGSFTIPLKGCLYKLPLNSGYTIQFKVEKEPTFENSEMSVCMCDILVFRNDVPHPELVSESIIDILLCNGEFLAE